MKIVLAHGVLGFGDDRPFSSLLPQPLSYFNRVKAHLERRGDVDEVDAWSVDFKGSIEARGRRLASKLATVSGPVHVIAHSMGGLDARWALTNDVPSTARVKSLTTIGTPHYGSEVADAISGNSGPLAGRVPTLVVEFLNTFAPALRDLTTARGRDFDAATPDRITDHRVDYMEIDGDASLAHHESLLFQFAALFGNITRKKNDGVVTMESALRGRRSPFEPWPFDHAGEVGWNLGLDSTLPYYDKIVDEIRRRHGDA
jgi:triacylglycerol lipase